MNRPYFEMKVVKVKKINRAICSCCGQKIPSKPIRQKGNWVNGENLDKIKFPCFCSFKIGEVKRLGQITTDFFNGYTKYTLNTIDRQVGNDETTAWGSYESLMQLILNNKVKIRKGKIIIFEEEK